MYTFLSALLFLFFFLMAENCSIYLRYSRDDEETLSFSRSSSIFPASTSVTSHRTRLITRIFVYKSYEYIGFSTSRALYLLSKKSRLRALYIPFLFYRSSQTNVILERNRISSLIHRRNNVILRTVNNREEDLTLVNLISRIGCAIHAASTVGSQSQKNDPVSSESEKKLTVRKGRGSNPRRRAHGVLPSSDARRNRNSETVYHGAVGRFNCRRARVVEKAVRSTDGSLFFFPEIDNWRRISCGEKASSPIRSIEQLIDKSCITPRISPTDFNGVATVGGDNARYRRLNSPSF